MVIFYWFIKFKNFYPTNFCTPYIYFKQVIHNLTYPVFTIISKISKYLIIFSLTSFLNFDFFYLLLLVDIYIIQIISN